jgi:protein-disulfide isomerase
VAWSTSQWGRRISRFGVPSASILLTVLTLALVRRPASSMRALPGVVYRVPLSGREATLGPADAPVTVVAFFDLSCRFSRSTYQTLVALVNQPAPSARLVFKHRPILPHGKGRRAALLVERAREQGRFWEAVQVLFGQLGDVEHPEVVRSLQALGVSPDDVPVSVLGQTAAAARVREDMALARRLGVAATPTLFVNGERFNGAISPRLLRDTIERHRQRAREALARGVPAANLYEHLVRGGRDQRVLASPRFDLPSSDPEPGLTPGPGGTAPVRLDLFCDDSCEPCADVERRLRQLRQEAPLHLTVRRMSLDSTAALARRLGIWRVPTLFINGRVIVGAVSEHRLLEELEAELQRAQTGQGQPPASAGTAIDSPGFVEVTFPEVTPQQSFESWVAQRLERTPSCLDAGGGGGELGVQATMTLDGSGFRLNDVRVTPTALPAKEAECFARTLAFSGPVRLPGGAELRIRTSPVQLQTRVLLDAQTRRIARRNTCPAGAGNRR